MIITGSIPSFFASVFSSSKSSYKRFMSILRTKSLVVPKFNHTTRKMYTGNHTPDQCEHQVFGFFHKL